MDDARKALMRASEKTGEPLTSFELAYGALDVKGYRCAWTARFYARFYDHVDEPSNEGHGDTPDKAVDELLRNMT